MHFPGAAKRKYVKPRDRAKRPLGCRVAPIGLVVPLGLTADLARAEGVKSQSMGTAIATLEKMGLVERRAHPTDGRQMNIVLTAKGKTMRKKTREAKHAWLAHAIEKLDKKEQEKLFAAGEVIKKLVDL